MALVNIDRTSRSLWDRRNGCRGSRVGRRAFGHDEVPAKPSNAVAGRCRGGTDFGGHFGCSVRLLNDVRMATLGDSTFGHGAQMSSGTMAFFSIGTGIGGGVVIDGKLRLGPLGAAGELGHQTLDPHGPPCGCGNRGCLEALASGPAITAAAVRLLNSGLAPALYDRVEGRSDRVTPREVAAVAAADPLVREVLLDAARWIGIAAANVVTILHPDLIVLGGGVAEMGDILLDTIQREVISRVGMFPADEVRVVSSQLGPSAGICGAIALAMNPVV